MANKKARKTAKPAARRVKKTSKAPKTGGDMVKAAVLSSETVFQCPLFRVQRDKIVEPGGRQNERDVIRHNGSVVILALDTAKSRKNPWVVMERQYRHAANQFLWELPAGKIDEGEEPLAAAKRELMEETGYRAKKWRPLIEYYPSPGFLGEAMKVFVAEDLRAGDAEPEDDEEIELRLVRLSELLKMIGRGAILDGKTLVSILLYARMQAKSRRRK
jgi:ADP-ribose pyrophosphatase